MKTFNLHPPIFRLLFVIDLQLNRPLDAQLDPIDRFLCAMKDVKIRIFFIKNLQNEQYVVES